MNEAVVLDTFAKAYAYLLRYRKLPENFCGMNLADNTGSTIAHWAAFYDALPENFDDWHRADSRGSTVAHWSAAIGNLPEHFRAWYLADNEGVTVIEKLVVWGMENWDDRAALFGLKVRPELELTVADYILTQELRQEYPELKAEVRAWKVAQELNKDGGAGILERWAQRPFLR